MELEWDNWYITADEAKQSRPPTHAFRDDRTDQSWAIQRAHWLAGGYWSLHGSPPDAMVPAPTTAEIAANLQEELEHLERHVVAGDYTDPYEATYAILNGSRILSLARDQGRHDLEARGRSLVAEAPAGPMAPAPPGRDPQLRGEATPEDVQVLAAGMAPFVAMVRDVMSRSA